MGKDIYYFVRNYKFDFWTSIFAFISILITFIFSSNANLRMIISFIIIVISLIAIIYLRSRDKEFYFIGLKNRKDKDNWIGKGDFQFERIHQCFSITNAEAGYIFSKCLDWNNYKFRFEFKITNACIGAVVRAINLSNYVMLQIREDGIRPHVRINGGWKFWEHPDAHLTFQENLSLDLWYECLISCENENINIKIYRNKIRIFNRDWRIPSGALMFAFASRERDPNAVNIPFPIELNYGSVGFRDSGNEKALIKNILIEKII